MHAYQQQHKGIVSQAVSSTETESHRCVWSIDAELATRLKISSKKLYISSRRANGLHASGSVRDVEFYEKLRRGSALK